jgi:hypothetical protein
MNDDLVDIIRYTVNSNPKIKIDIHTNGSIRNQAYWTRLAEVLPERHMVYWGIDGLGDTHALYRINTDYNKILVNAQSFIESGGQSAWHMLVFRHNEHQVEQCKTLSQQLGFVEFKYKVTDRFVNESLVTIKKNTISSTTPVEQIDDYMDIVRTSTVDCEVAGSKSVYIDVLGRVWPCCYLAQIPYKQHSNPFNQHNRGSIEIIHSQLGSTSLHERSLEDIVNAKWQKTYTNAVEYKTIPQCTKSCRRK